VDRIPAERLLYAMLKKAACDEHAKLVDALIRTGVRDRDVWTCVDSVVMEHINDMPWPMPGTICGNEVWQGLFGRAYCELVKDHPTVIDVQYAVHQCARKAAEKAAGLWCDKYVSTPKLFSQFSIEQAAKRAAYLAARKFVSMMAFDGASLPEDGQRDVGGWVSILTEKAYYALKAAMIESAEEAKN